MGKREKGFERGPGPLEANDDQALAMDSHSAEPFLTHLISCNPDKVGNVIPIHMSFTQFVICPRSLSMTYLGFKAKTSMQGPHSQPLPYTALCNTRGNKNLAQISLDVWLRSRTSLKGRIVLNDQVNRF